MSGSSGRRGSTSVSGPGQKRAASAARALVVGDRHPVERGRLRQVDDQRVERRPRLHLEDARDRARVEGVGAEAVDGLGGEGDEAAALQHRGRVGERQEIVRRQDAGAHGGAGSGVWARPPRAREASSPQAASMSGPPE